MQQVLDKFHEHGDYKQLYTDYAEVSHASWANTQRPAYKTDQWYCHNRNRICLELLGDLCEGRDVLSVGSREWVEDELLKQINGKIVRTDLIAEPEKGIIGADVTCLPFKDQSFNVVICREVIEHVPDADAAFTEMRRVLRQGGHLLITTPNGLSGFIDGVLHVRGYSPISFLEELSSQGFEVIGKKGDIPYLLTGIVSFKCAEIQEILLQDFMEIDRMTRDCEHLYYLSTHLYVLCKKRDSGGLFDD
ncbi:MAG: class I SAM-dependent methyltransferase [Dehalococcoidia bacterium]